MDPTPQEVLPVLAAASEDLYAALRKGIAYADELQPDRDARDPWFWSHSARFKARSELLGKAESRVEGYRLREGVPNCGIHLGFDGVHKARVVRSLGGTTPAPGRNPARRRDWRGVPVQTQLLLAASGTLPPLSMIIDWQDVAGEPVIHVGLPRFGWDYRTKPLLHWRVPLPDEGIDYASLVFDGSDDGPDNVFIEIDPAEGSADGG